MTDMRGLYKPLAKAEEQEEPKEYWGCNNGNFTFTSSRPSRLCSRIPVLLVGAAIVLTGLMLIGLHHSHYVAGSGRNSEELAAPYRRHLSSPLHAHKVVHSPASIAYVVGEHHPVSGDFPADYQWVDPDSREPFDEVMTTNGMNNNAMARMPVGSPYDMMVVGRGWSDKYIDPTEHIHYVNLTLVGFFVNYEPISGSWIRAGPEPYILDIPIWRQFPRPCRNLVNGGPADPRLIWSDAGEPLAIIGTSSQVPGVCKAVGLADLRAVWPGLKQHLADIGYGDIPIRLKQFTELGKAGGQAPYEKNWAAFFSGPSPPKSISNTILASKRWIGTNFQRGPSLWPYFLTQMKNHSVVAVNENQLTGGRSTGSYVMAESLNLTVTNKANETYEASSACIFNSLPLNWDPDRMHLATPFYRVTFCRRDACEPSRENTVLLGLIHYKKSPQSYMRMFVTMKVDAPFEIISVSPPLHFGAPEMDSDVVFSVSMAFLPSKRSYSIGEHPFKPSKDRAGGWLAHGWLDDTIVVGVGLRDAAYDAVHIPVATALQGHTLCS